MSYFSFLKSWLMPEDTQTPAPREIQSVFSSLPELETERLILRKAKFRDAAHIFQYARDPEVSRYVLWDTHETLADSRAYVRYLRRQYALGAPSSWVIVHRESMRTIGTIGYMSYDAENEVLEVGYSLAREFWNQGIMTEALKKVIAFSFETLAVNRLEAVHEIGNPASGRVLVKCGMKYEGVLRERVRKKGRYVDVAMYGIIRRDYL